MDGVAHWCFYDTHMQGVTRNGTSAPTALTLETISPRLLKGGEMRSPAPQRRKSRRRDIRLSGSGEGLGWATSLPPLQACLPPFPSRKWRAHHEKQ